MKRDGRSGYYDRFRGRLMFPIHNESGKIIAFAGRTLAADEEPKYMNSPETPIYRKSFVLYNLHRARKQIRKTDHSILVEGYMDVIGLHAAGISEAVASCGTALTSQQVRVLRRHSGKIVVNFDPDAAGTNAAERSIQMLLEEGMHIRILQLEENLDPDDYVKRHGAEGYRARLNAASGYFHWLADRARRRFDMNTAEGRVEGFKFLLPSIQKIDDKLERAAVANDIASYLGVESGLVLEQFRGSAVARREQISSSVEPLPLVERMLLSVVLNSPAARDEVLSKLRNINVVNQFRTKRIFETMYQFVDRVEEWDYPALEARLEDADKNLLATAVLADQIDEQENSLEQALACLSTLEAKEHEARLSDVKARVKAAERAGDIKEALRLNKELNSVEKKLQ